MANQEFEGYINSHNDSTNTTNTIVRFCDVDIKYEHPSREDMIAHDMFWTKDDFTLFHKQALYEMKICKMKYQCTSIKQITNLLYLPNVSRPPRIDGQTDHPEQDVMEEVVRDIEIEATRIRNTNKSITPIHSPIEIASNNSANELASSTVSSDDSTAITTEQNTSITTYSHGKKRLFSNTGFVCFLICVFHVEAIFLSTPPPSVLHAPSLSSMLPSSIMYTPSNVATLPHYTKPI